MLMRRISISLLIFIMSLCLTVSVLAQPNPKNVYTGNIGKRPLEYVPGEVVVKFAESVGNDEVEQIVRGLGAQIKLKALKRAFHLLSVPHGQVMKMVQALKKNPRVVYAHPDYYAYMDFVPTDPYYPLQWNLDNLAHSGIEMEQAWEITGNPDPSMRGGDPQVIVVILDTGIAYENFGSYCQAPDLVSTSFVAGYDFVNNDTHPNDDNAHGTHVAGTIAQSTNNATGVAGIAFNISLMPVKVLNANGSGSVSTIANAIRWAADRGVDVINMSLSTAVPSTVLEDAVNYAYSKGVLIIASSGNSSGNSPQYPANYANVIAVGATTYGEQIASYSNRGNEVCAPGGIDHQDLNGDGYDDMVLQNTFDPNTKDVCDFGYWFFSGTSMAAPHVSGLAALMLSMDSTLTNEDVRTILRNTADTVEPACGYGLINAYQALQTVANLDNPPSVKIKYPLEGEFVSGNITVNINATDDNDGPGALTVEWNVDGGDWGPTTYNSGTGLYDSDEWDTTKVMDGQHFIYVRATDRADNKTIASNSVLVNNVNDPPMVSFSYTCSGLMCDFEASGSYDPDGTIQSYDWSFGDDTQSESGRGATVSHTYAEAGTYSVSLTVTDDGGASNSYSENISVTEGPPTEHIGDLDASSRRMFGRFWEAKITFTVHDSWHDPVAGAWVYGLFSDGSSLFKCSTDGNGKCTVYGYQYWLKCLTFTVTDLWHGSLVYDPAQNQDPDGDSDGTSITVCRP